jgi:HTH domain
VQHRSWWSESVSTDEAHARYLGRRRYNSLGQARAGWRRLQVAELLAAAGGMPSGVQARIARHLGVSRATISRDVKVILRELPVPSCPCYGALCARALDRLDELLEGRAHREPAYRLSDHDGVRRHSGAGRPRPWFGLSHPGGMVRT